MPLLKRSRTAGVQEIAIKDEKSAEVSAAISSAGLPPAEQRRPRLTERPKTADARDSRSFSRPRTATAIRERSIELRPPIETIQFRSGNDTYDFPTPSPRLPPKSATSAAAPPFPSPQRQKPSESPAIGVALGSPSQAPMPKWGRSQTPDQIWDRNPRVPPPQRTPPMAPKADEIHAVRPDLKRKKSGWKALGELFGRKPSKSGVQDPFAKVQLTQAQDAEGQRSVDTASPPSKEPAKPAGHRRVPSMTRGTARFEARAQADLATFHPESQPKRIRSPSMVQNEGFSPMFRALTTHRESQEMFSASSHERNDSPLSMNEKPDHLRTPRLDLEIPNPDFERYSVMFEKLLDDSPKPSLLERRQSKHRKSFKKLEPITSNPDSLRSAPAGSAAIPQRSLTSPHLSGLTSRLSVKVNPPKDRNITAPVPSTSQPTTTIHRARPILRSKTAPSGTQSPLERAFFRATKAVMTGGGGLTPTSQTFSASENSLPPTPNTTATASERDSVAIFTTAEPYHKSSHARNMNPTSEPSWNNRTFSAPAKTAQVDTHPPRVKSLEDRERQIVQVSVARQVSVSKARRQVQHALASKQPLRPRVVEVGGDSKVRKSTVVVLEGGEEEGEGGEGRRGGGG